MNKLNNKGQSLVMLVIIVPIIILILTLVYDVGSAIYEKNNLANTSYMVIDYGLDNIGSVDESSLIELIQKNTSSLNYISVIIADDRIEVKLGKNFKGVIGKMFGFDLVEVNSYYEGQIIGGEKKIERMK